MYVCMYVCVCVFVHWVSRVFYFMAPTLYTPPPPRPMGRGVNSTTRDPMDTQRVIPPTPAPL